MYDSGRVETFRKSRLFQDVDAEHIRELSRRAVERSLKAGQFLFVEGDRVEACYLVASGMVKILKHSSSGTDFITAIYGPGEMMGNILLIVGKPHPSSAQAIIDTRVLVVKSDDFTSFLHKYPEIGFRILGRLLNIANTRYHAATLRLTQLAAEKADYRLAHVLFTLYLEFGPSIPLTRGEIAEMAGTSTETAARFVSRLRQTGILRSFRGKVVILDQDKLRQLVQVLLPS